MKNFKDFDENDDLCFTFKVDYWCDLDERIKNEQVKIEAVLKRQKRREKLERIFKKVL